MRNAAVHSNPGDSGTAPTLELYTAAVPCYVTHVFELKLPRDIQVNIGKDMEGKFRKEWQSEEGISHTDVLQHEKQMYQSTQICCLLPQLHMRTRCP